MSARSRKMLSRTRKSSTRNSPFATPSIARINSKNSVAFEFECESLNSSISSVFTDSEVCTETKKKKSCRSRKIRKTEECSDATKSASKNILTEIPLSASRSNRKKKKPIFTLPDNAFSFKSDSTDLSDGAVTKIAKQKRKIRYTQDLNILSNDRSDSDISVRTRAKKTKKARRPSFLPPVDIIDNGKKLNKTEAVENLNLDNKENYTDTTDSEEGIKNKTRRRTRRTKKKTSEDEKIICDSNEKHTRNDLENKNNNCSPQQMQKSIVHDDNKNRTAPLDGPRQSMHSRDENNSKICKNVVEATIENDEHSSSEKDTQNIREPSRSDSFIANLNIDVSIKVVEVAENNSSKDQTSDQPNTVQRRTFEVSPNKSILMNNSEVNKSVKGQRKKKRSTFNVLDNDASNILNKTGNTSDFDDESMLPHSEMCREQNNDNEESIKNSLKTATFDISSSDGLETSSLNNINTTTSLRTEHSRTGTVEIRSNIDDISDVHGDRQSSKRATFDIPSNWEGSSNGKDASWLNESSLVSRNSIPDPICSNLNEISDIHQDSQLKHNRRSTRNRASNRTMEDQSQISSNGTNLRTSRTPSSAVDGTFTSESLPSLKISKSTKVSSRVSKRSTFDIIDIAGKESESEEIESKESDEETSESTPSLKISKGTKVSSRVSRRSTFDIIDIVGKESESEEIESKESDKETVSSDSEEDHRKNETVIDLTESVDEDGGSSPNKNLRLRVNKSPKLEGRKSSFEVSFNAKKNHGAILDHLNITRTDSRKKSSKKKSSNGFKYSAETDSEDTKSRGKFVTLRKRRECHTMIDFDTGNSPDKSNSGSGQGGLKSFKDLENLNWNGSRIVLSDKSSPKLAHSATEPIREPTAKKSILKKSMGTAVRNSNRDTFGLAEEFYDVYDSLLKKPAETNPTVSLVSEVTPIVTLETQPSRDIFDFVSKTPTKKLDMIGSGESLIVGRSFLNDSNVSVRPSSTFTKDEIDATVGSGLSRVSKDEEEKKTATPSRKSTRKRWSEVERTAIFNKTPKGDPSKPTGTTLENTINKSKSVRISTPPFSPRNYSLRTTPSGAKNAKQGMKSVKIETPVKTPKIRLHSPLVMRKTPGPDFRGPDNSILSGNCVGKLTPQKTSTPYVRKKDVSLLQTVLTSEKNKSEKHISLKSVGKNSVRSKMPNFSKIHQRQFEKMENLKEMQERKAARAQFLLSGSKPPVNTSAPKVVAGKESRKQLKFSPKKQEPNEVAHDASTSRAGKPDTSKQLSKPQRHMLHKRVSQEKKKKETKSRVPVAIARPVAIAIAKPEPKGFTRFGFKLPTGKENVTRDEQIKAVTTKSKIAVNRTETNRKQLGGVRSNRRFELLMKMRESQNKLVAASAGSSGGFKYQPKTKMPIVGKSCKPDLPNPPALVATAKQIMSKPLQHMLKKKTLKGKMKNQAENKIHMRLKINAFGKNELEGKGFTRFGFKLPTTKKNITKADQIKAVSLKSRLVTNRTEENRYRLREVRGNRRFELLMKLRESNSR